MDKKGFTVVELIVSFGLVMMVVIMLLQIITIVKTLYVNAGIKTELLSKQAVMNRKISQRFNNKNVKAAVRCGEGCLTFIFEDDTSSILKIDKKNNKFSFINNDTDVVNYTTKLLSGSSFGDIDISNETIVTVSDGKNNSIIHIKIPIRHSLVDGDYGINLVYQYDSRVTAITDIIYNDQNVNEGGTIVLKGSSDMTFSSSLTYSDPGYYVVDEKGVICTPNGSNTCGVTKTADNTVGKTPNTTYTLTFQLKKDGKVVDEKIRRVLVIDDSSKFDYTGDYQIFTAPERGIYKIELWGALGNTNQKGTYTSGETTLNANEKLYIYVGEKGISSPYNNGGTDVRLKSGGVSDSTSTSSRILAAPGGLGGTFNLSTAKTISNKRTIAGTASMPNPRGSGNITGNSDHGYVKITLVSVTS